jgi:hypothetical protein
MLEGFWSITGESAAVKVGWPLSSAQQEGDSMRCPFMGEALSPPVMWKYRPSAPWYTHDYSTGCLE